MMHGKTSQIEVERDSIIFNGLPKEFRQTRYHSLTVNREKIPDNIIITSYSKDDHEIMSLEIKDKPIYGVQFHPESILTKEGKKIIKNFVDMVKI